MECAHRFLPVLGLVLLTTACGGDSDSGTVVACTSNSACDTGSVCTDGTCRQPAPAETGTYSAWTDWSACSVICATGTQQRTRTCQGASGELRCSACGGECTEAMACTDTAGCTYAYTAYGFFDDCSVQCGGGTEERTRVCVRSDGENADCAQCGGECALPRACNDVPNCTYHYGLWGAPTSCSTTCGTGTQQRTRSCLLTNNTSATCTNCGGNCTDEIACSSFSTCTYSYGTWSDFSSCPGTCGGAQTRTRTCTRSDGAYVACTLCGGVCDESQTCAQSSATCGAPAAWTFSVTSTYASYTGQTQSQSTGNGGLSDGKMTGAASVWGSNPNPGGQSIIADFGAAVYVTAVRLAPIDSGFDGWGSSYSNGLRIERSVDGTAWTLVTTTTGTQDGVVTQFAVGQVARYIRLIRTDAGYVGVGELTFL